MQSWPRLVLHELYEAEEKHCSRDRIVPRRYMEITMDEFIDPNRLDTVAAKVQGVPTFASTVRVLKWVRRELGHRLTSFQTTDHPISRPYRHTTTADGSGGGHFNL